MSIRFTVKTPRPRNPLAAAARQRHAGVHRPSVGARRQRARNELRRAIDETIAGP